VEQLRCFIAIGLPDEVKAGFKDLQAQLKSGGQGSIKWVDPYSIHLTLKFLGGVDAAKIPPITAAMEEATQGIAPFSLKVEGLGAFPNLRRVQVVWVGLISWSTSSSALNPTWRGWVLPRRRGASAPI